MTGPIALVGSGEYLPHMQELEASLIAGRPARYVQLPTAAAPEGDQSLQRWIDLGVAQAHRMGVEAVPLMVRNRQDADSAEIAAQVAGAGLIYMSGGNPGFLAQTLEGTAVWQAIVQAWQDGAALAGCSAGAMAIADHIPALRRHGEQRGLGLLPHIRVLPHFDKMLGWVPDLALRMLQVPGGVHVVGHMSGKCTAVSPPGCSLPASARSFLPEVFCVHHCDELDVTQLRNFALRLYIPRHRCVTGTSSG